MFRRILIDAYGHRPLTHGLPEILDQKFQNSLRFGRRRPCFAAKFGVNTSVCAGVDRVVLVKLLRNFSELESVLAAKSEEIMA
jgi:hypothetical protein